MIIFVLFLFQFLLFLTFPSVDAQSLDGGGGCFCPERMVFSKHENKAVIKSPVSSETKKYCENLKCKWLIKAGYPGTGTRIKFDSFVTEKNHDYLDIIFVAQNHTQRLKRISGLKSAEQLLELSFIDEGSVELIFTTDFSSQYEGFEATFERFNASSEKCKCPRIFYDLTSNKTAEITSPNHPQEHCHSMECFYLITARKNHKVHLHFSDFDLESFDFLHAYDGNYTSAGNLLASLSGTLSEQEKELESKDHQMFMVFQSDLDTSHPGFRAVATEKKHTCVCPANGTIFIDSSGEISSPGYEEGVLCREIHCRYRVKVAESSMVQLTFSSLQLQDWDSLCVYYGSQDKHGYPMICWHGFHDVGPENLTFTAESNDIVLVLSTGLYQYTANYKGFHATYQAIQRPADCHCPRPNPKIFIDMAETINASACGPMDCMFILDPQIMPPDHDLLTFTLKKMNIHNRKDYVKILYGSYNTHNNPHVLKTYSGFIEGNSLSDYVSVSGKLTVHFHVSERVHDSDGGFEMEYKWSKQDCRCGESGLTAEEEKKILTSPGYPLPYCSDLTCDWVVSAPNGYRIVAEVVDLVTEHGPDKLEFFDGQYKTSEHSRQLLGIMSGSLENFSRKQFRSTDSIMTIIFNSDYVGENKGFNLTYHMESTQVQPPPPPPTQIQSTSTPKTLITSTVAPTTTSQSTSTSPSSTKSTSTPTSSSTTTTQPAIEPTVLPISVDHGRTVTPRSSNVWLIVMVAIFLIVIVLIVAAVMFFRKGKMPETNRIIFDSGPATTYIENRCYDNDDSSPSSTRSY